MITEKDINLAFENEFDGVDKFSLVQEILEEREINKQIKELAEKITSEPCFYVDTCPLRAARNGKCDGCKFREILKE